MAANPEVSVTLSGALREHLRRQSAGLESPSNYWSPAWSATPSRASPPRASRHRDRRPARAAGAGTGDSSVDNIAGYISDHTTCDEPALAHTGGGSGNPPPGGGAIPLRIHPPDGRDPVGGDRQAAWPNLAHQEATSMKTQSPRRDRPASELQIYLQDINETPSLSARDEVALAGRIETGDPAPATTWSGPTSAWWSTSRGTISAGGCRWRT